MKIQVQQECVSREWRALGAPEDPSKNYTSEVIYPEHIMTLETPQATLLFLRSWNSCQSL